MTDPIKITVDHGGISTTQMIFNLWHRLTKDIMLCDVVRDNQESQGFFTGALNGMYGQKQKEDCQNAVELMNMLTKIRDVLKSFLDMAVKHQKWTEEVKNKWE